MWSSDLQYEYQRHYPFSHIEAETKWTPFRRRHFRMHFLNENAWISLTISLKFVPKVRINNIPALVQIMAWRLPGDKPLSEPMMVSLRTHICVTRPQWVKIHWPERSFIKGHTKYTKINTGVIANRFVATVHTHFWRTLEKAIYVYQRWRAVF